MTPPIHGGPIPQRPSTWPTVIGILLIVLASIGLLTNVCGGIASLFMPALMGMAGDATDDPMMSAQIEITDRYMIFNVLNAAILLGLGVVLLIAGIGLLRRRRTSRKWALVWAIGRIAWSLPAAYLTYVIMLDTVQAMQDAATESGEPMPPGMTGFMEIMGPIGALLNLVMWCAIPVFVLIWFNLAKIKNEVATWQ